MEKAFRDTLLAFDVLKQARNFFAGPCDTMLLELRIGEIDLGDAEEMTEEGAA